MPDYNQRALSSQPFAPLLLAHCQLHPFWQVFYTSYPMALHKAKHFTAYITEAKFAEQENDVVKAIELYELAIRQKPLEETPYERLMIIYRKQKRYKDEIRVIQTALDLFMEHYDEKANKLYGNNKRLLQTGKALLKSLSPKGKNQEQFYPEPIPKWIKRKETAEKKINPKK